MNEESTSAWLVGLSRETAFAAEAIRKCLEY